MMDGPFNVDELEAQRLAGGGPARGAFRTFMPDQHREFFAHLPYLVIGVTGEDGWPLATFLAGTPGFVSTPEATTLRIDARPANGDPARPLFHPGNDIAVLGLNFSNRRRNRANGVIAHVDDLGLTMGVRESFGNCPQYIQRRNPVPVSRQPQSVRLLSALDPAMRTIIANADTMFVASHARGRLGGTDVSHRGGRPGFVRIEGDTLTIPDFRGNRHFNTLGNLLGEPRASLLFLDFASGDALQLMGVAEIDWSADAAGRIEGAERLWRFKVVRGWLRPQAVPFAWSFVDYSPATEHTGLWRAA